MVTQGILAVSKKLEDYMVQTVKTLKALYSEYGSPVLNHKNVKIMREKTVSLLARTEKPAGFVMIAGIAITVLIASRIITNMSDPISTDENLIQNSIEKASRTANTESPNEEKTVVSPARRITEQEEQIPQTKNWTLKKRETLSSLLKRAGFGSKEGYRITSALSGVADLRRLKAGQDITIERDGSASAQFNKLILRDSFDSQAIVMQESGTYYAERQKLDTVPLTQLAVGTIEDSLYLSAKREDVPDQVIIAFIHLLSFSVDFQRDIRRGDTFEIYFERQVAQGYGDVENGRILYGRLVRGEKAIEATYYAEKDGLSGYYNANGESIRKALMKTPVDGARLTSRFGRRKHPILGYTRLHKGLDFAAPRGTPIMAAGDGVVERASRHGGYGKYIRIRHANGLKTAYAHLNGYAKGIKKGKRVEQGDIIGYVGTTGRSTGPHLHYEILNGKKQVNPLTLKMPSGRILPEKEKPAFTIWREEILAEVRTIQETHALLAQVHSPALSEQDEKTKGR